LTHQTIWPIRNSIWPIRNQSLAYQEPNAWPIRNLLFGLLGTTTFRFPQQFKDLRAYSHPVTRARDLNRDLTLLTSNPDRWLKRGLRPLAPCMDPTIDATTTPPLRGLRPLPAQTQPTRHTPIRKALRASSNSHTTALPPLAAGKWTERRTPVAALYPTLKEQSECLQRSWP
jgi:hypothetical protein